MNSFSFSNWWSNGWASRIALFGAIMMLYSMTDGWQPDHYVPGSSSSFDQGGYRVTRTTGDTVTHGAGSVLSRSQGWLAIMGGIAFLYFLGKSRTDSGGFGRWAPSLISILLLLWLIDSQIAMKQAEAAWYSREFGAGYQAPGEAPFYFAFGNVLMIVASLIMAFRPWKSNMVTEGPPPISKT